MNTQRFSALGALLITSLISCSESPPKFHADTNPSRLSDWGLFDLSDESLTPTQFNMVWEPHPTLVYFNATERDWTLGSAEACGATEYDTVEWASGF